MRFHTYLANAILGLFICLMRFYLLFILLLRSLGKNLANAILCTIHFITVINLPNATFWLMRLFPSPKSRIRREPFKITF